MTARKAFIRLSLAGLALAGVVGVVIHEWARKRAGRVIALDGQWYEVETQDPPEPDPHCALEGYASIYGFGAKPERKV